MKKQSLSELFSKLDLPAEELPELYSSDDISYKSIQKRVRAKIEGKEIIEPVTKKPDHTKRFMLGLGIAAALIAGGAGVYGASDAGRNVSEEETRATIDSRPMEIEAEADLMSDNIENADEAPDFSEFEDVYDYEVVDSIDELDVKNVKLCCKNNTAWILVHFKSDLPEGISVLDTEFGNHLENTVKYGNALYTSPGITSESDEENLYILYEFLNSSVDPMENEYLIKTENLFRKNAERITDFGMRNLMGFTNAEINANKEYTDEMKARIAEEYTKIDDNYYRKEDVFSTGRITIRVDPSERELDINESIIPATIGLFEKAFISPEISNTIDELNAELAGIRCSGTLTEVLLRFTPENGYTLTGDEDFSIFEKEKVLPYIIDPETGLKHYLNDKPMRCDSYTDIDGITNDGVPCIYHKIELATEEVYDLYLEVSCEKLLDPADRGIISNGEIRMDIHIGNAGRIENSISDSFTTEDGFDIDISFSNLEMIMEWQSRDGEKIPAFLKNCSRENYVVPASEGNTIMEDDFTLVMKNGWEYPLRMNVDVNDDGSVTASSMLLSYIDFIDNIDRLEFDGKTIYKAE